MNELPSTGEMTEAPSLLSLVLSLRPAEARDRLPFTGRAAHALLLRCLQDWDPPLAGRLHADSGPRPFTASALIGGRGGLDPERCYHLRLAALTAPVAQTLTAATTRGHLAPGQRVELAGAPFTVEAILSTPEEHPWAAGATYETLSAPWLLGKERPGRHLVLRFTSPTSFKSAGKHVPIPLPGWVFGSLVDKWNAFGPVLLPAEARRFAEEELALSAYALRTASVRIKEGGLRVGAVGWARDVALNRDRYWLSLMNLLADYALYAGAGIGTSMGLGQCRRQIDPED